MKTREAKRVRNRAVRNARRHGHDVALISKSGAVALYGCLNNCDAIMDIWDSPAIVNGPMHEVKCRDGRQSPSLGARVSKYFYDRAAKFLSPKR